jgi:alkanesulfonate monooxygenase SsuD/methylene tetrahydromethanopterin reductase-like flavin-dependent oxidoreductase (luciferase family)
VRLGFGALLPPRPGYLAKVGDLEAAGFEELWFPDFQLAGADPFDCRALMHGGTAVVSEASGPVRFLEFWRTCLDTETRIPVRIAAGGPRTLQLAGAIADEVIIGTIDPALLRVQIGHVRAGARGAGRAESDVGIAVLAAMHVAEDEPSPETLRAKLGGYVINMLVSNGAAAAGREDELDPALVAAFGRAGDAQARAAARAMERGGGSRSAIFESYMEAYPPEYEELLTAATMRAKALYGSEAEIRGRLAELADVGVTRVVLYPDPEDAGALETFAHRYIA